MEDLTTEWLTPEFFADPYPFYHDLRATDPVYWSEKLNGWIVSGYHEVVAVLRDAKAFSSAGRMAALLNIIPEPERGAYKLVYDHFSVGLIRCDPPDHTRLRTLISKTFTPRSIEELRPRVRALVNELLDSAQNERRMDAVNDFAYPLPATVICEMLGVPAADRARVRTWSEEINSVIAGVLPIRDAAKRMQAALADLREYYTDLIEERRRLPRADLLSLLAAVEEQGDRLSLDELLSTAENLLAAGHETTTSLISNAILTLFQHPDQHELLKKKPDLLPSFIEEVLRYESPVQRQTRVVRGDIEFGGRQLRNGQLVFLMIGAANRDPAVFSDPDTFDITRPQNPHIAFGLGIHFCIGSSLARLEARLALDAILNRFPNLALGRDRPEWKPTAAARSLKSLSVLL